MAGRRKSTAPAKPWAKKKAERRVVSIDEQWAEMVSARVRGDCHPFQLLAVDDPARFITLLVGRGGGKTTTMRARALQKLTSIRRGRGVYIAPTRDMAEELMWGPLKDSIEFYGLSDEFTFNETKLRVTCKRTGCVYRLVGLDDKSEVNKLRGRPFDWVDCDEASLYPAALLEELIDRAIGPRLGERNGVLTLAGTPGHILSGPFYDFTRPGSSAEDFDDDGNTIAVPLHRPYGDRDRPEYADWDSWSSHAWTLKDVASLPEAPTKYRALVNLWAEALRVKKRKRWSDQNPIWLREYLGQWASDDTDMVFRYRPRLEDGTLWNQWDPFGEHPLEGLQALQTATAKLKEWHPELKDWRYVVAGDKGSSDPCAWNVFAFSPQDAERRLWHVMPWERTRTYAKQWAELMLGPALKTDKPGGVYGIIGWPDGGVMDSDQATLDELGNVYGLRYEKADRNPLSKMGAIELTNGGFVDGQIKILKGSPLEKQLTALQWAEDAHGRLKENKAQANHSTDTLVYARKLVATLYESGVVVQDDAAARGPYADPQGLEPGIGFTMDQDESSGLMAGAEFHDNWG